MKSLNANFDCCVIALYRQYVCSPARVTQRSDVGHSAVNGWFYNFSLNKVIQQNEKNTNICSYARFERKLRCDMVGKDGSGIMAHVS